MPIVQDAAEIHHSTVTFNNSTENPLHDKDQELIINTPKRGIFDFHFHLTSGDMDNHVVAADEPQWKLGRPKIEAILSQAGDILTRPADAGISQAMLTSDGSPNTKTKSNQGMTYETLNVSTTVSRGNVGVMVAGPNALVQDVQLRCIRLNQTKLTKYEVHTELFEF
jgi:hypothetical protein